MPPAAPDVLYVLDANPMFGTAVETTRLMHQLFAELPPLLVVGIAYPPGAFQVHGELRTRDFTPTRDDDYADMLARIPNRKPLLPEGERMGGAAGFLSFLRDQVKPLIADRYRTSGKSILFGTSLGGLFALYALLTAAETFDAYSIGSPAIWWDGGHLFGLEERLAQRVDDLDARVFMGVGSTEESDAIPWSARMRMVSNLSDMAARLNARDYASLALTTHVFDGDTHTTVIPQILTRGLPVVLR